MSFPVPGLTGVVYVSADVIFEWYFDDVIVSRTAVAILNHVFEESGEFVLKVTLRNDGEEVTTSHIEN